MNKRNSMKDEKVSDTPIPQNFGSFAEFVEAAKKSGLSMEEISDLELKRSQSLQELATKQLNSPERLKALALATALDDASSPDDA